MSHLLQSLRRPVIAAPMAGGPSTPELVAAVGAAGGLGFLPAGMVPVHRLLDDIRATRALSDRPFGVNLFLPDDSPVDPVALRAYADRIAGDADAYGVAVGEPVGGDDGYPAKLRALLDDPVPLVSFVFGLPDPETVAALRERGSEVWATVCHPDGAVRAAALGVDAIVMQGTEAGGHRGATVDGDDYGVLPLLRLAAGRVDRPLVAAGGVIDGPGLAAVLVAGASAAQLGTAFLRCPEAGTSALHREAVAGSGDTRLTRVFTGRRARAVVNRFVREHDATAPFAYPHVMRVTRPLLAAARERGDAEVANLWAGQAHALARAVPAGQVVEELAAKAAAALAALRDRLQLPGDLPGALPDDLPGDVVQGAVDPLVGDRVGGAERLREEVDP